VNQSWFKERRNPQRPTEAPEKETERSNCCPTGWCGEPGTAGIIFREN